MNHPQYQQLIQDITYGTAVRRAVNSVKETDGAKSAFMRLHKTYFVFRSLLPFSVTLEDVLRHLTRSYESLERFRNNFNADFVNFASTENNSPRVGAIVMDCRLEYVLLVKPPHNQCYSFPKRKKIPDDSHTVGAMAEVKEEIGLEIQIEENSKDFLLKEVKNVSNIPIPARYYNKRHVCLNTPFRPQSKEEIGQIVWFNIEYLAGLNQYDAANDSLLRCDKRAWDNMEPFLKDIQADSELRRESENVHDHGTTRPKKIVVYDASMDPTVDILL